MPLDQIDVDKYEEEQEKEMSFLEHLEELRWHLVRSIAAVFVIGIIVFLAKDFVFDKIIFAPRYDSFLTYQVICGFSELIGMGETLCFYPPDLKIIVIELGEVFFTHIKVSVILAFALAFPYLFWEIWRFVKPGLYDKEQKATRGIVLICSGLFLMGILFGYYVISPFAVTFLAGYPLAGLDQATVALSSFVNYMIMFTVPSGLIFELPIVVFFLAKAGLVTPEFMRTYRKHAFIIILVLAAVVTPPDVVTQFLIGIPLFILYEISIHIAKRVEKQHEKEFGVVAKS
ncbi:MAG: twin-arginine translocase subunit TatC [Saprospiraceae bacterium]|jgi:sec-independent protein translocase protein TatC|nr:twin-arginine translocase subunit TatC [Saprospiraceae bacterium]